MGHIDTGYQDRVVAGLTRIVRDRALPADTLGLMLCAIRAIFRRNGVTYPRFAYSAYVDKFGQMTVDYARGPDDLDRVSRYRLGSVDHVTNMLRYLADALDLNDADRIALFTDLRQWIKVDERAQSNLEV